MTNIDEYNELSISLDNFRNSKLLSKFTINNVSGIKYENTTTKDIQDISMKINSFNKKTGISQTNFNANINDLLYLFIFDEEIIIINQSGYNKLHPFFEKNRDQILFLTSNNNDKLIKSQNILKFICKNIILKSLLRSKNQRFQANSNSIKLQYKEKDFIKIHYISPLVSLYYNINDQFVYIIKTREKKINHEIEFYNQINNQSPLISKCYGIDDINNIIIVEYIEGKSLQSYISKNKNHFNYYQKLKIIFDIMIALEFIHSNGFVYCDLKWDNIIIDSKLNAILIDFDQARKDIDNEKTGNIGGQFFTSPEQYSSNYYTSKSDIYSLGIIINIILTEKTDLQMFLDKKNIINIIEMEKKSEQNQKLFEIYKNCLQYEPNKRPSISDLINKLFYMLYMEQLYEEDENINSLLKEICLIREKHFNIIIKENKKIENNELFDFFGDIYSSDEYLEKDINKSINYLTHSANQNSSFAQCMLGTLYYFYKDVPRDINKSIYYLTLSANQNNPEAQFILGQFYFSNEFVKRDINKSIHYLMLSAEKNNSNALCYLGYILSLRIFTPKKTNKIIKYFYDSSNQGNIFSKFFLGCIYFEGILVKQDVDKSIEYFNQVLNQNDNYTRKFLKKLKKGINKNIFVDSSMIIDFLSEIIMKSYYYLGIINYNQKEYQKSIQYLTLSANQNYSDAQYKLGFIYYKNEKVPKDINKSIHYLKLSADQNNSSAQLLLGYEYYNEKSIQNIDQSIHYLSLSANQNDKLAQLMLGKIYYNGEYIPKDISKAIYYFKLSANQNNDEAQYYIGFIYYNNFDIKQNIKLSISYLLLSANQNNNKAQYLLGEIYLFGDFDNIKSDKAIHYLYLAANQNNEDAIALLNYIHYKSIEYLLIMSEKNNAVIQYFIGFSYFKGINVQKNIQKSINYLTLSAKRNNAKAQNLLGLIYSNKDLNFYDLKTAIYYYTLSANQNDSTSQYELGNIYYDLDITKSIYYLELASNQNNADAHFYLEKFFY